MQMLLHPLPPSDRPETGIEEERRLYQAQLSAAQQARKRARRDQMKKGASHACARLLSGFRKRAAQAPQI